MQYFLATQFQFLYIARPFHKEDKSWVMRKKVKFIIKLIGVKTIKSLSISVD